MKRHWIVGTFMIWIIVCGSLLCLSKPAFSRQSAEVLPDSAAQKIALERYWLMKRIGNKTNLDLYSMVGDYSQTVVFPIGRADHIYFLYDNIVACYQNQHGQDKLVYRISLHGNSRMITKDKPAVKSRNRSLLDYLTKEVDGYLGETQEARYYTLPKGISAFVKSDLSAPRNYVQYTYDTMVDTLTVVPLFDPQSTARAIYDIDQDPITQRMLNPGEFYRRYGLPVAKADGLGATLPFQLPEAQERCPFHQLVSRVKTRNPSNSLTNGTNSSSVTKINLAAFLFFGSFPT